MIIDMEHWLSSDNWQVWLVFAMGITVTLCVMVFATRSKKPQEETPVTPKKNLFALPAVENKRVALRRKGGSVMVEISNDLGKSIVAKGWVMDRSLGGIKVLLENSISVDGNLQIRIVDPFAFMPWLEVSVRHISNTENGWELGCQFVKVPPYNILLQFG